LTLFWLIFSFCAVSVYRVLVFHPTSKLSARIRPALRAAVKLASFAVAVFFVIFAFYLFATALASADAVKLFSFTSAVVPESAGNNSAPCLPASVFAFPPVRALTEKL
jgi:hypothetical protein